MFYNIARESHPQQVNQVKFKCTDTMKSHWMLVENSDIHLFCCVLSLRMAAGHELVYVLINSTGVAGLSKRGSSIGIGRILSCCDAAAHGGELVCA